MGLVKIKFLNEDYLSLAEGKTTIDDFIAGLFTTSANYHEILTQLNNYHSDEDGAPVVPAFEVSEITYRPVDLTGQVRFAYHVDFTFACADKRATTDHFETSNFTIDPEESLLSLFVHDKISRDTYEEF